MQWSFHLYLYSLFCCPVTSQAGLFWSPLKSMTRYQWIWGSKGAILTVWTHITNFRTHLWLVQTTQVAILDTLILRRMDFWFVFIIIVMLPCHIPIRNVLVPFKKYDSFSTDWGDQRCTQFIPPPAWTINADSSHPHEKDIHNYLYVPKGH